MKSLLRIAYRAMIRMHPASFRREFGEEMLWIFDKESHEGITAHLLFDGIRSIALQHAKPRSEETSDLGYREVNSAPPVFRLAQAGFLVLSGILFMSLFFSPSIPKLTSPTYSASDIHHSVQGSWLLTRIRVFSLPNSKSAKI
jgi:hypothetical protein